MAETTPPVIVELRGQYAEFVLSEADASGKPQLEIVERALALYAVLGSAIVSGQQLVLQHLFENMDEPLLRIDHYLPPSPSTDLASKPIIDTAHRTHGELFAWPPMAR